MKKLLKNIQRELKKIEGVKYVDTNWGQLDYYSPNFPVLWPCVLIDITDAQFSNIGINKKTIPRNRQQATAQISLTVANLQLTNSSGMATAKQQENAIKIWDIIAEVHKTLHGFRPDEKTGVMIRESMQRVIRDDGVQEYKITYSIVLHDV